MIFDISNDISFDISNGIINVMMYDVVSALVRSLRKLRIDGISYMVWYIMLYQL